MDGRAGSWSVLGAALALALLAVPGTADADCNDPFADPDDVLDFHIRLSPDAWSALRFDAQVGSGCDAQYAYHEVEFRCGDEPWITIGARRKRGDQRGRDTDEKPPIKLDFNRFVQGQRWPAGEGKLGFRKLTLNNGQQDNPGGQLTALLTEHYAWRLMRAEVPIASRVAYAKLWVHFPAAAGGEDESEYHGLYILIEDIDRTALRARFGDGGDRGVLSKTTTGGCRDRVVFDDRVEMMLEIPAFDAARAWLDGAPHDGDYVQHSESVVDLDSLIRQEALRDVLGNGADTPMGRNYSNFYSFDAEAGLRHYVPWDLDDAFRPFPQPVPFDHPLEASCSEVGERTRCHDELQERYLEVACQLLSGTLAEEKLLSEMAALDAMLRPLIGEEVDSVWGGFDPRDESVETTYGAEYQRVRRWVEQRIPYLRDEIESRGVACPDRCADGSAESCSVLGVDGERRCQDGRFTTCVLPDPPDEPDDPQETPDAPQVQPDGGAAGSSSGEPTGQPVGRTAPPPSEVDRPGSVDAGPQPARADEERGDAGCAVGPGRRAGYDRAALTMAFVAMAIVIALRRRARAHGRVSARSLR